MEITVSDILEETVGDTVSYRIAKEAWTVTFIVQLPGNSQIFNVVGNSQIFNVGEFVTAGVNDTARGVNFEMDIPSFMEFVERHCDFTRRSERLYERVTSAVNITMTPRLVPRDTVVINVDNFCDAIISLLLVHDDGDTTD